MVEDLAKPRLVGGEVSEFGGDGKKARVGGAGARLWAKHR